MVFCLFFCVVMVIKAEGQLSVLYSLYLKFPTLLPSQTTTHHLHPPHSTVNLESENRLPQLLLFHSFPYIFLFFCKRLYFKCYRNVGKLYQHQYLNYKRGHVNTNIIRNSPSSPIKNSISPFQCHSTQRISVSPFGKQNNGPLKMSMS